MSDPNTTRVAKSFQAQGLMKTLGARLLHVAPGEVHIAVHPGAALSQQHGYVHAGVLTSIADSACGYSALTLAADEYEVLTVEFKMNFLRPAVGDRFVAEAKVVKPGKSLTVCQCDVYAERSGQRTSIALMQCTLMNVLTKTTDELSDDS